MTGAASLTWYVQRVDEALTEQVRSAMPYAATLGIEMLAASKDEVHAAVEWEERLTTAAGILHGGVLMGLADTAGAYCAFLNLPEGSAATATIESKTNFFSAVRSGRVEARSRPLHRGSRTIVVETDLFDDERQARRPRHPDAGRALTRRLPLLLAVLVLVSGCGGETLTVTVTVTETTAPPAPRVPPRLPFPLPEDGTLPVEAFDAYTESVDYPWERSLSALTDAFVEAGAGDVLQRSFESTSSDEEGTSATTSLTRRPPRRLGPIAALPAEAQPA